MCEAKLSEDPDCFLDGSTKFVKLMMFLTSHGESQGLSGVGGDVDRSTYRIGFQLILQGSGVIWRPVVGTIVERTLVVLKHDAHWSCKLLCLLGVEDKNHHVEASEYGGETSDSSTNRFSRLEKSETVGKGSGLGFSA